MRSIFAVCSPAIAALFVASCTEGDRLTATPDATTSSDATMNASDATVQQRDAAALDAAADASMSAVDAEPADAAPADAEPPDMTVIEDAGELDAGPLDAGTSSTTWTEMPIAPVVGSGCSGTSFVRWVPAYQVWISITQCTSTRYKIAMGDNAPGPYYSIGDFAGNGQDHCELVNPAFTIPNEDDITSGGCTACALGPYSNPGELSPAPPGWSRARFGDPFVFEAAWPIYNLYTPSWYECDVALP